MPIALISRTRREHVPHHDRRKAERRLVHQQELRRGDEGAGDRNHLLLAAAQRTGHLVVALAQSREALEHLVDAALHERLCRRLRSRRAADCP